MKGLCDAFVRVHICKWKCVYCLCDAKRNGRSGNFMKSTFNVSMKKERKLSLNVEASTVSFDQFYSDYTTTYFDTYTHNQYSHKIAISCKQKTNWPYQISDHLLCVWFNRRRKSIISMQLKIKTTAFVLLLLMSFGFFFCCCNFCLTYKLLNNYYWAL